MTSYLILETIPEDLLFTISLYLDQHALFGVYKLFKPRLYDKLSFWYTKYDLDFPDVDWNELVTDQTKNKFFLQFYNNYLQFEDAYMEASNLFNNYRPIIRAEINYDEYDFDGIISFQLNIIKKLDLLNPNFIKEIDDKLYHLSLDKTTKSIFEYPDSLIILYDDINKKYYFKFYFSDEHVILHDTMKKIYYHKFGSGILYEISHKQVMNIITYIVYNNLREFLNTIRP